MEQEIHHPSLPVSGITCVLFGGHLLTSKYRWPKITPNRHGLQPTRIGYTPENEQMFPVKKGAEFQKEKAKKSSSPTALLVMYTSQFSAKYILRVYHRAFLLPQKRFQCLQSVRSVDTEGISFSLLGHIRSQASKCGASHDGSMVAWYIYRSMNG